MMWKRVLKTCGMMLIRGMIQMKMTIGSDLSQHRIGEDMTEVARRNITFLKIGIALHRLLYFR